MFPGIDNELKELLFSDAPDADSVWIGSIYELHTGKQELLPIKFGNQCFWIGFSCPSFEAGNDAESLQLFSEGWADGFEPAEFSRLVKFARADAMTDFYKPDLWKLSVPEQVYQFSQTIADAVTYHFRTYTDCSQYFFWPASKQLELLYKRAFRYIDRDCLPGHFAPILGQLGVFNGYQRT